MQINIYLLIEYINIQSELYINNKYFKIISCMNEHCNTNIFRKYNRKHTKIHAHIYIYIYKSMDFNIV